MAVEEIRVPERTAAGKPFDVHVRLANDGPAREVHLFGALYAREEGKAPCGPTTDSSFRTFTHVVQVTVTLPADGVLEHPPAGERWLHRYDPADAGMTPTDDEFCVFVAAATGGPVIQYDAYGTTRLSVRARNAPPQPSFAFDPARPESTQAVRFTATAADADDDPVAFAWDFGRFDAGGRATAEGAEVTHAFYPEGDYVVTLTASDGIDSVPLTRTVTVHALGANGEDGRRDGLGIPVPAWLVLLAVVMIARLRRP